MRLSILAVMLVFALTTGAGAAEADSDEHAGDETTSDDAEEQNLPDLPPETPTPDVAPPFGTGATTAPELAPKPQEDIAPQLKLGVPIRFYGIIKPTVIYAFQGMESFSQPNETAETAAANPVLQQFKDQGRMTVQIAQSRLGFIANEEGRYRGQVEIDFWDPSKPNPSFAYGLRVRTAKVSFVPSKHFAVEVGRDFEMHAPLGTHTLNLVGALLEAGNISQFRNQVKIFYRPDNFEIGFAIGMPGDNNGQPAPTPSGDGANELSRFPAFSGRIAYVSHGLTIGVSGIGTQLIFDKGTPQSRLAAAFSGAFYMVAEPVEGLNIRVESYGGRNQNNIGLRALGFGRGAVVSQAGKTLLAAADIDEVGGFISVRQAFATMNALYAIAGIANVLDKKDVIPDYTRNADGNLQLTNATTGPGIKRNIALRLGYELRPVHYFAFVIEGMCYDTLHTLQASDSVVFNPHQRSYGVESGVVLTF